MKMQWILKGFLITVLNIPAFSWANSDPIFQSLDKALWNNRVILLFQDNNNEQYQAQKDNLDRHCLDNADRDLIILSIDNESRSAQNWRKHFGIDDRFGIILIGKDGGEKFRSLSHIHPRDLYDLIDGMPMRRSEMRDKTRQFGENC